MDYGFKPTTNGRNALAACMALGKAPNICRVAFGSGMIAEDVNLADQHTLLAYVADGTITNRRHQDDHFYFTIQYANREHPEVETFYLSEFIAYIEDPVTGAETDLLYGTLGDYRLPVPRHHESLAPAVFDLPLVIVVSDAVTVKVTAPPGLVTWDELQETIKTELENSPGIPQISDGPPTADTPGTPGQHYFDTSSGVEYTCAGTDSEGKTVWTVAGGPTPLPDKPTEDTPGVVGQHAIDAEGKEYICVNVTEAGKVIWKPVGSGAVEAHNADPAAHGGCFIPASEKGADGGVVGFKVVTSRIRDPAKPTFGLGGGGDDGPTEVVLETGPYTGQTEIGVVVSGVLYDAENMSTHGDTAPDGTIIIKTEEQNNG